MVKRVVLTLDDDVHADLVKKKGKKTTWVEFVVSLAKTNRK
jgi:hypothetical protein